VNPDAETTLMGWQANTYSTLKTLMEMWAKRSNKMMVLVSSGDTLYGGCTEAQLQGKYDAVIAAANETGSRATIVAAAEVSPFPADMGAKYSMPAYNWTETRRSTTLSALGIPDGWAKPYAECTDGPCDPDSKYQYAHAGFIMGPVEDLLAMFEGFESYTSTLQRFVNDYYLKNPDKITLDYGGILATTLNNMNKDGGPIRKLDGAGSVPKTILVPKGVPEPVCFLQGNGNGIETLKTLAGTITASLSV